MIAGALLLAAVVLTQPNHALTPGVTRPLTTAQVCATKWGKDKRFVTKAMKARVYAAYGVTPSGRWLIAKSGRRYWQSDNEIDHLVSRELGGADDERNLWPQPYEGPWNARMKDRLEGNLHVRVCAGTLSLEAAQKAIADDWQLAFKNYVDANPR